MTSHADPLDTWTASMLAAAKPAAPVPPGPLRPVNWQVITGGDSLPGRQLLVVEYDAADEQRVMEALKPLLGADHDP